MWARLLCSTNQPSFLDHKDVIGDENEEVPQIQSINGENHLEARATKHREPKDVTEDTREEEPPILLVNGNSHLEAIRANQKWLAAPIQFEQLLILSYLSLGVPLFFSFFVACWYKFYQVNPIPSGDSYNFSVKLPYHRWGLQYFHKEPLYIILNGGYDIIIQECTIIPKHFISTK